MESFSYDVFLSYSSKDKDVVRAVAEQLQKDGLKVWFDEWELKPGDSIPAKIEEGLERSRVLVICMSANAFGSDWAQLESGIYRFRDPLNKEQRFIPLRLDDAPIKGSLAQFNYINWQPEGSKEEYAKLLEACSPHAKLNSTKSSIAAKHFMKNKKPTPKNLLPIVFGIIFITVFAISAFLIPEPTAYQVFVFRVILALAAGAFGATIPGYLSIKLPIGKNGMISAGGALGLLIIFYLLNPPELIRKSHLVTKVKIIEQVLSGTIIDISGNPISGVILTLEEYDVIDTSDNFGKYYFKIKAPVQQTLRVMAQKKNLLTIRHDATLGNTNFNFKMEPSQ